MSLLSQPKSDHLRQLYWRDEILQLLFWIEGEGFGEQVETATLERFLELDKVAAAAHLERLSRDGLLEQDESGAYRLSLRGREEGGRIFATEFSDLTQPAHGACGRECWCRSSSVEAAACQEERRAWRLDP
ncbi:MAG: hypothetical protein H0V36_12160 [Chloroflexi bacterium]|nr:hypothetical protein [Chloroflexota bacterium]